MNYTEKPVPLLLLLVPLFAKWHKQAVGESTLCDVTKRNDTASITLPVYGAFH